MERLIRLAEDLLVLDRSGEAALRPAELDARELLDAVARRFATRAAEAGRAIEVHGGGTFHGDRDRLEQALGSLVDNALTHGAGVVRLEAARDGDSLVLRVSDEGDGFPPDFLPHAFERFSRADAARTTAAPASASRSSTPSPALTAASASAAGATVTLVLPAHPPLIGGD